MKNYRYHNECIRRNQAQGGSKPDPPSFFPWRLQWGFSVFQWGSNPPANFYPVDSNKAMVLEDFFSSVGLYTIEDDMFTILHKQK